MAQVADSEKARLIELMQRSRMVLGQEAEHLHTRISSLKSKLDVPARMKASVMERPGTWLASSLGLGFASTRLFRRKEVRVSEKPKRGIVALLFTALFSIVKAPLKELLIIELTRRILPAVGARRTR